MTSRTLRADLTALIALFLAIVAGLWAYGGADAFALHRPLSYSGDGLSHGFLVKTILDVGWYPVHTPFVGAPFGSDLFDYPFSDALNFLLVRLIGLFTGDWVVVSNAFYVASFFLSGVTAYLLLRALGVGRSLAVAGAFVFAVAPYHFARRGHLLLASYAVVPVGVWLAWRAWNGTRWRNLTPRSRALVAAGLLGVGSGGAYYAFFAAFITVAAGAARALSMRSLRELVPALALVAGLALVVLANVAPSLAYRASKGPNAEVAARNPGEAELYGLKLAQMVLPSGAHRAESLREVAQRYGAAAPLVNENATAALGMIGAAGLLVLLAVVAARAFRGGAGTGAAPLDFLALVAFSVFLLGTIGGLGSLFAFLVSPILRAYNRVSIVIACVSIAAIALIVDAAVRRAGRSAAPMLGAVAALGLMVAGGWDQIPAQAPRPAAPAFDSDAAFVRQLETALPRDSNVLQLPYQSFPEAGSIVQMENYGPIRGYLHSRTLRWSYGAMRGRPGDVWLRALHEHAPAEEIELAAMSGFGAVYVDRRGYVDRAAALETTLRERAGAPIAESADHQLVAYRLTPTGAGPLPLARVLMPIDTPIRFDRPTLSGLVEDVSGLSGWEPWGRWTNGPVARVQVSRELPAAFTLHIETAMALAPSAGVDLRVRVGAEERTFKVGNGPTGVDVPFRLSQPARVVEIMIPQPRSPAELGMSTDTRKLGIGLKSITIVPQ